MLLTMSTGMMMLFAIVSLAPLFTAATKSAVGKVIKSGSSAEGEMR